MPGIQPYIDAFLPAVAYLQQEPKGAALASRMVLGLPDAPQLGRLPDLGQAIRLLLMAPDCAAQACGWSAAHYLQRALPCVKPSKASPPDDTQCQVALCVLLGLLLGLYPAAVRFPPFPVRVALYRRVHGLITHGTGRAVCDRCPALLTLAFMEYCAHVVPAYMPAEDEALRREQGVGAFFAGCSVLCDSFRQECLQTGEEPWAEMERHCAAVVERHTRMCKGRGRQRGQEAHCPRPATSDWLQLPYLVPYETHAQDSTKGILRSEMACLGVDGLGPADVELAALAQSCVYAHALPSNVRQMQLRALRERLGRCERSALSGMQLVVCMACVVCGSKGKPTRGQCKLDLERDVLVCASCQSDAVLSVSTLGRVVTVRQSRYYLAPCCCTVQLYTGRGDEFIETQCRHEHARPPARSQKRRCELCSNVALAEGLSAVDHLTGEMHTAYLCQRHTPHQDALGQVSNWRQLEAEVRKRDRPLFRNER